MATSRRRSRGAGSRGYERTDRLGELLREIVAEELERIDDERLELVTITGVDVDRELERARVFYTSLGHDERDPEIREALAEHRGRVRRAIGNQARVRRVPEVRFEPDDAQRAAERIDDILRDAGVADDGVSDDGVSDDGDAQG
jgi:ribosome-binding factor A